MNDLVVSSKPSRKHRRRPKRRRQHQTRRSTHTPGNQAAAKSGNGSDDLDTVTFLPTTPATSTTSTTGGTAFDTAIVPVGTVVLTVLSDLRVREASRKRTKPVLRGYTAWFLPGSGRLRWGGARQCRFAFEVACDGSTPRRHDMLWLPRLAAEMQHHYHRTSQRPVGNSRGWGDFRGLFRGRTLLGFARDEAVPVVPTPWVWRHAKGRGGRAGIPPSGNINRCESSSTGPSRNGFGGTASAHARRPCPSVCLPERRLWHKAGRNADHPWSSSRTCPG